MFQFRLFAAVVSCAMLAACGVSETAVTAASVAKGQAEQAQQAKQQMDQMQQQINNINTQADARLQAAESAAQ